MPAPPAAALPPLPSNPRPQSGAGAGPFETEGIVAAAIAASGLAVEPVFGGRGRGGAEAPAPAAAQAALEDALAGLRIAQEASGGSPSPAPSAAGASPPAVAYALAYAVVDQRDAILALVERTAAALEARPLPDGSPQPALAALAALAAVLRALRQPAGVEASPQPLAGPLFAIDVLDEPPIHMHPDALPPWAEPPPGAADCEARAFLRAVEECLEAARAAPGPAQRAAGALEAAGRLASDALLLSPWVRSFEGRLALRRALVVIREASGTFAQARRGPRPPPPSQVGDLGGRRAQVRRVAEHLRAAALRRLRDLCACSSAPDPPDSDDAIRGALDAVEALRCPLRVFPSPAPTPLTVPLRMRRPRPTYMDIRPNMYHAAPDLHVIALGAALDVVRPALAAARELAERGRAPGAGEEPRATLLWAEALVALGGQLVMDGVMEEGIGHLFEAWSLLLRAGPVGWSCPSRLEARIVLYLAEAHGAPLDRP
eukprot:tig00001006_g6228.t1